MPEGFAGRDVRQMQLDERNLRRQQRVAQCDARVSECGRIEQNHGDVLVARRVDAFDERRFGIALKRVELVAARRRLRTQRRFDVGERGRAVDAGLAPAKLPQIGAVEQQKPSHGRHTCATMAASLTVFRRK
jgi:hypothetical protein